MTVGSGGLGFAIALVFFSVAAGFFWLTAAFFVGAVFFALAAVAAAGLLGTFVFLVARVVWRNAAMLFRPIRHTRSAVQTTSKL